MASCVVAVKSGLAGSIAPSSNRHAIAQAPFINWLSASLVAGLYEMLQMRCDIPRWFGAVHAVASREMRLDSS
jgi:hypothetical protein